MLISKWFFGLIFLLFALSSQNSFAQSGKGCLIGATLYPDLESDIFLLIYKSSNPKPTQAPACPRIDLVSKTGRSCRIGFWSAIYGDEYNYETLTVPIGCPIDDYIFLVLMGVGSFGFFYLRKEIV